MSKMCEARTVRGKSLGSKLSLQTLKAHDIEKQRDKISPKEVIQFGKDDMFKITIEKTREGQKRTSPIANLSSGQKVEKKRSATDNSEPQTWGDFFRQQTLWYMSKKPCTCKCNEEREIKKNINVGKQQKSPVKSIPVKSEEKHLNVKTSCCPSVLVQDCAVQCSETYDSPKFAEFNPVQMLCLVKQLQNLVDKKDKKTCEIFTEMEQILQKIPDQKTKESSTTLLKESSKKMKAMSHESLILEKLQSEILQRDERLKEVDQKYTELKFHVKMLTEQLDEATREKNDIISMVTDLKRQIENNERIITNLKTDLNKQTELAHKKNIDNKYLTMEIDKLSALSSYKDTQIINYRNTIKELQNQSAKQLKTINEIRMKEGSISPQLSLIHTGRACSSSTSNFSDASNKSWHLSNLSDISSVDSIPEEHALKKDTTIKHFVSLLDGESSHTIMPEVQNEVTNDKGSVMQNNNENNTVPYQNVDANDVTAKKLLHHASEKCHKKNDIYKTKKLRLKEKQNDNTKNLFFNISKALENITSTKITVSDIRKQDDIQNRKPVNVPSPLRDCPHPDWSDSSLPSISTVSNLDTVPSNNV